MRLYFDEIKIWIRKEYKIFLLLMILSTIGIFCISVSVRLLHQTGDQKQRFAEVYEDVHFFRIMDNFVGENEYYLTSPEAIPALKDFYDHLQNSEYFDYILMYENPIYVTDYNGPESNVDGYEHGSTIENSTVEFMDESGEYYRATGLKALWIGDNVFRYFDLGIREGRSFSEDDFIYEPGKPVGIILGDNYSGFYSVGDIVTIDFIFSKSEAEIIGFLEDGSNVLYRGSFRNMDDHILMPMFSNDSFNGESVYRFPLNHIYGIRNQGTVATKLAVEDVYKIISEYAGNSGFTDAHGAVYYVDEYDPAEKRGFEEGIDTLVFLLAVITMIIVFTILLIETMIFIKQTDLDKRYYAIMYLNGCSRGKLFLIVLLKAMAIGLPSMILGYVIHEICYSFDIRELGAILMGGAVFICLPIVIYIVKCPDRKIISHIRRSDD